MATKTISCPSCKCPVDAAAFLAGCSNFWAAVGAVRFTCPLCQQETEAQLEHGRVILGYTYAAGRPHFCGMEDVPVDDLRVWRDSDGLGVELDGVTWKVAPI